MAVVTSRSRARVTPPTHTPKGPGLGGAMKRVVLGPALPTSSLAHERLGKPTALAVFASDNLSSVAYATEEILKVAVPVAGVLAFGLVMPITFGILAVLAILLFSYRQTIKAYPSAGGAYIVTKDNFGLLPAQVAGVALLTDYVLTVSVSVAAGVAAITSAFPAAYPYRVWMSVVFIWFIAWGNLRGVRESGRMFAVPTYFFIAMMFLLLGVGIFRIMTGTLEPLPVPPEVAETTGAVSIFLILRAFASGGAAVTGVEAISNGVPAFKPPEWRNARSTLMWMGSLLGVMFLGLSFIAFQIRAVPTETTTVISEVGRAVFGGGLGHVLFLMLQFATMMILILAANTSFADFPRLANFHATDNFMPRQLTKRGHRLVFSNGIVGLAISATALVVLFQADVHRLIPLYAIGVFLSFTLSQSGMAKRHLRLREPGWRHGLMINGLGAVTTAVVTVVIATTKFVDGAWAIIIFVPVLVLVLVRMNRHYEREQSELEGELQAFEPGDRRHPSALVLIEELDHAAVHTLQYAKTIRAHETIAVHLERDPATTPRLRDEWTAAGLDAIPLRILRGDGDEASRLAGFVGAFPDERPVAVLQPVAHDVSAFERLSDARDGAKLTRALLPYDQVSVTLVRDHPQEARPLGSEDLAEPLIRFAPRDNHHVLVVVDRLDRAVFRAVRYALGLGGTEVRALHAAADLDRAEVLMQRWLQSGIPVPLDVIECWDRNVPRAIEHHVLSGSKPEREITVVMPRRDFPSLRQRLLHDRTSRSIARAVARYPHVDVTVVPYFMAGQPRHADPVIPQAASSLIQR